MKNVFNNTNDIKFDPLQHACYDHCTGDIVTHLQFIDEEIGNLLCPSKTPT